MSQSSDIKNKISEKLNELIPTTLAQVIVDDFQPDILEKDLNSYPAAIVSTPLVNSDILTNRENQRAYTYEILVVCKGEDIATSTDVEIIMDAILDKFDGNGTLDGAAINVDPATIPNPPLPTPDRSYILFSVFITAMALADANC